MKKRIIAAAIVAATTMPIKAAVNKEVLSMWLMSRPYLKACLLMHSIKH